MLFNSIFAFINSRFRITVWPDLQTKPQAFTGMEESLTKTPPTLSSEAAAETAEDIKLMPIEDISIYGGTQTRASTNDDAIDSYVESIEGGQSFPPVEIYFDGTKYWLADGFHRLLAYKRAGRAEVRSKIFKGSRKDALLHALGANSQNSLYRSNADKRNAVEIALEEFPEEPNTFIAKICAVSASMVGSARKRLDDLNREEDEPSKHSKPQVKANQVSVPAAGIDRQPRGSSSDNSSCSGGNSFGKSGKSSSSAQEELLDLDDFDANEPSGVVELSPFVYAENAIKLLSKIPKNDPDAETAYARVMDWLEIHANRSK